MPKKRQMQMQKKRQMQMQKKCRPNLAKKDDHGRSWCWAEFSGNFTLRNFVLFFWPVLTWRLHFSDNIKRSDWKIRDIEECRLSHQENSSNIEAALLHKPVDSGDTLILFRTFTSWVCHNNTIEIESHDCHDMRGPTVLIQTIGHLYYKIT